MKHVVTCVIVGFSAVPSPSAAQILERDDLAPWKGGREEETCFAGVRSPEGALFAAVLREGNFDFFLTELASMDAPARLALMIDGGAPIDLGESAGAWMAFPMTTALTEQVMKTEEPIVLSSLTGEGTWRPIAHFSPVGSTKSILKMFECAGPVYVDGFAPLQFLEWHATLPTDPTPSISDTVAAKREAEETAAKQAAAEAAAKQAAAEATAKREAEEAAKATELTRLCNGAIQIMGVCWEQTPDQMRTVLRSKGYVCGGLRCDRGDAAVFLFDDSVTFECHSLNACSYSIEELAQAVVDQGLVPELHLGTTRNSLTKVDFITYCTRGAKGDEICVNQPSHKNSPPSVQISKGAYGSPGISFD